MKKDHEKTVALCAIAGNVEQLIWRFVTSFQQLTPHVYIVRACGSQTPDKTLELARGLGCKVAVYENAPAHRDWPHVDHFGNARQMAFKMALADGHDFLMWADTDDVIHEASVAEARELIKRDDWDVAICPYRLSNNGLTPFRERIVRSGKASWVDAIHEHLEPIPGARRLQADGIVIDHLPGTNRKDTPNDRNIRILESLPFEPRWGFYVCQEYEIVGRHQEKIDAALQALNGWKSDRSKLQACEAYELFMMLSRWSTDPENKLQLLREAWGLEPWRREALAYMSALYADRNDAQAALATSRMMMVLPEPQLKPWTHRAGLYKQAGLSVYTYALRMNGHLEEADKLEKQYFASQGSRISVIHAARGRVLKSAMTRKMWLERAKNPEAIEYLFGIGEDDRETRSGLGNYAHALSEPGNMDRVGGNMIANLNAAFRKATGRLIVVASDDVEPPIWWDELIWNAMEPHLGSPAVLGVRDGYRQDDLLVTQIFTPETVRVLGLEAGQFLCPEYPHAYADNEFTVRCRKAGIVQESLITFIHHHPAFEEIPNDPIYRLGNSEESYRLGKELFERRNA